MSDSGDEEREWTLADIEAVEVPADWLKDTAEELAADETTALALQLRDLSIPQKIKLALFGGKQFRALLIRDTNRQVPLYVLQNARLGEEEVHEFARNTNLSDGVLRTIGNNSQWMKNYAIRLAIVSNPRVPIDVSLRWLKFIQERDLRLLARSKNIPQVIATQARKIVEKRGS